MVRSFAPPAQTTILFDNYWTVIVPKCEVIVRDTQATQILQQQGLSTMTENANTLRYECPIADRLDVLICQNIVQSLFTTLAIYKN
jgi:hypothetical protein